MHQISYMLSQISDNNIFLMDTNGKGGPYLLSKQFQKRVFQASYSKTSGEEVLFSTTHMPSITEIRSNSISTCLF